VGTQINGRPEWVQYAALITFDFFLYPLSFSLLHFSIEGLLRSAAGIAPSEVVPNLPVGCAFKVAEFVKKRRQIEEEFSLPPDHVECCLTGACAFGCAA
jgi:hypothetical protein